ncbi:MAG: type II secretion system protein [Verrucomicrobiota bacterium]
MKNTYTEMRRLSKKAGLTLIELLVVLVILIATGSLLVPTIKDALTRSHVSTCATTFPEVHQMMQRVQLEFGEFGDVFDSGIHTGGDVPVNDANATFTTEGAGELSVSDLSVDEVAALAAVGITTVVDHDSAATDFNVTFNIGATSRALSGDSTVITLTDDQADAIFLPNGGGGASVPTTSEKYVWFGIGRDWTLLGDLTPEPPVHFGDTAGVLPDEVHSRFGIIVQVADESGDPLERAEFKRTSYCIDGDGFETGDNHIEVYWTEVAGQ